MQHGVSYTPGQLLAVVASRTVLVVDAPTDWSLAGPLWELALDDAPVDEILDVLVRRGIRTSPSFAIVRVEGEAVRALVRGSVPVCFERTGEPVRLDATGATTWLEGLISGATRVLVGGIEQRTELPYLVDTGVVLVAGLALPTAPARPTPGVPGAEPAGRSGEGEPGDGRQRESQAREAVFESSSPIRSEPPVPAAGAGEAAARPPRVVDLTRSAPRTGSRAILSAPAAAGLFAEPEAQPAAGPAEASDELVVDTGDAPDVLEVQVVPEAEVPEAGSSDDPTLVAEVPEEESPAAETSQAEEQAPSLNGHAPNPFAPFDEEPEAAPAEASEVGATAPAELPEDDEAPAELHVEHDAIGEDPSADTDDESRVESELLPPEVAADQVPGVDGGPSSFLNLPARGAYAPPPWSLTGGAAAAWGIPELAEPERPEQLAGPEAQPEPLEEEGHRFEPSPMHAELQNEFKAGSPLEPDVAEPEPGGREAAEQAGRPDAAEPEPARRDGPLADVVFGGPSALDGARPAELDAARVDESELPELVDADDLLVNGSARGPLPTALPNFDPPSVSLDLQHLRGRTGSHQGAHQFDQREPAAADRHDEDDNTVVTELTPLSARQPEAGQPEAQQAPTADERVEESFEDYVRSRSRDLENDEPAALPFRVRGQSLRPEHQIPFGGLRSNNGSWPRAEASGTDQPEGFFDAPGESPFIPKPNGVNGHRQPAADEQAPDRPAGQPDAGAEEAESEGLLLPAFFRGARAARSKTADPVTPDHPAPVWARGNNGERQRHGGPAGLRGSGPAGEGRGGASVLGNRFGESGPALGGPGGPGAGVGPQGRDGGSSVLFTPPGGGLSPQAPPREPPRLLGVWCDAGHVTSPDQPECRVCGLRVPPQAPILVARPPLGVLIFDNGDRVEVDRPVVLGRDPKPVPSPDPEAPVLHAVASRTGQVSRTHAEIRASGWDVVLTDLDAMNGTTLTSPGGSPVPIEPGVPTVITSGSRADLGGESGFTFEVEG